MKLTIVGPVYPFRGGIAHHTAMLVHALNDSGHQSQMVSFIRQYPGWLYPGKSDKDPSQDPLKIEASYLLDPLYPWTWYQTARKILAYKPEGVLIQWWTTFWGIPFGVLTRILHKARVPVIFLIHNVLPHEERFWDRMLARFALSKAKAYIVQTEREKGRLQQVVGTREIYLCRLPNFSFFRNGKFNKLTARASLAVGSDQFVLLFFGLVRPYKGLNELLQALAALRKIDCFPKLLIAGEFWGDQATLMEQIHLLGLDEQVRIDNRYIPDEEVKNYFSAADCLVAPYTGGTQSGAAAIAISFGLPMIVSENVAQGIDEKKQGSILSIVPGGDVQALAKAIRSAVQSPPQSVELGTTPPDDWERLFQSISQALH